MVKDSHIPFSQVSLEGIDHLDWDNFLKVVLFERVLAELAGNELELLRFDLRFL